jgi:hypothetical protein
VEASWRRASQACAPSTADACQTGTPRSLLCGHKTQQQAHQQRVAQLGAALCAAHVPLCLPPELVSAVRLEQRPGLRDLCWRGLAACMSMAHVGWVSGVRITGAREAWHAPDAECCPSPATAAGCCCAAQYGLLMAALCAPRAAVCSAHGLCAPRACWWVACRCACISALRTGGCGVTTISAGATAA